jgi:hypothetical protein
MPPDQEKGHQHQQDTGHDAPHQQPLPPRPGLDRRCVTPTRLAPQVIGIVLLLLAEALMQTLLRDCLGQFRHPWRSKEAQAYF